MELLQNLISNCQKREKFRNELLSEFAYKLNLKNSFLKNIAWYKFAVPHIGFSYDKSISETLMNEIKKEKVINNPEENIIVLMSDFGTVSEGIVLTPYTVFVNSPKNKDPFFHVNFFNIKKLNYIEGKKPVLEIITHSDKSYYIDTYIFNLLNIKMYIQLAMGFVGFTDSEKKIVSRFRLKTLKYKSIGNVISGTIFGNASIENNIHKMRTFMAGERIDPKTGEKYFTGHGYAAERMNHLYDLLILKKASLPGNDLAANGPDRLVDNVFLQSKYCSTGKKCIDECFDKNTKLFRYLNSDGSVMKIEVPSDKYDEAVLEMAKKIKDGRIPGHTNPNDAKDIVVKGRFTYEQAKNVAQAGTVESLAFDAVNGIVISTCVFGVTALLTFACAMWNGESVEQAAKEAFFCGIQAAGISFITTIVSSQLARCKLPIETAKRVSSKIINSIGNKKVEKIAGALKNNGTDIYGVADSQKLKHVVRNNLIAGAVSILLLSSKDIKDIFMGRISVGQFGKNVVLTTSGVAAGYVGFGFGAAKGASVAGATVGSLFPGYGTAIGAVGGFVGGLLAASAVSTCVQTATNGIMSCFIDDDTKEIIPIIEKEIINLAELYLLNVYELQNITDNFSADLTLSTIKDIYSKQNKEEFIDRLLMKYINIELDYREKIYLPEEKLEIVLANYLSDFN